MEETRKNEAAIALGRLGGQKRAETKGWNKIPKKRRKALARKAVMARWAKKKQT